MDLSGMTLSGGFTFVQPPPAQATAGWYGTGSPNDSRLERQLFATDTLTASYRATLTVATNRAAGTFTFTYGWIGGGIAGSYSAVQRITFASDTSASSVRGPLDTGLYALTATGNTTDGWFCGGAIGAPTYAQTSRVQRITYATDTATASNRGPLSSTRYISAATGTSTDGWIIGGFGGSPGALMNRIDRITYANDNTTASVRGSLPTPLDSMSACSDGTTYAWAAGGGSGYLSTVQRITFATDTASTTPRGPLSLGRERLSSATQNATDGWFAGGITPSNTSRIDRITFATDTATASIRGPLSATGYNIVGLAGVA